MPILTSADYPSIRGALDTSLDAAGLPDATIALPTYEPRAELLILRRDPLAAARTGTEAIHVKNAAILLAAALIAPAMPALASLAAGSTSVSWAVDKDRWAKRAADLWSQAEDELDAVLDVGTEDTADRPAAFALASGGRSWLPAWRIP